MNAPSHIEHEEAAGELNLLHIRADRTAFDLHNLFLAPVQELVQYKELIRNIVSRDLKKRYKRSVLGIAWTVIAPLMSMLVLWTVFTHALRVEIENYAAYLFSGIIAWNLFVQSSTAAGQSIINNAPLILKIRLPRVIFPISAVINNLINLCFAFVALLIVMLISGCSFHWSILLTPIMIIPLVIFSFGWAMAVSALTVFFRDLIYILEISLSALYFLTPILYAAESVPANVAWTISFNPLAKFIHLFRSVTCFGVVPSIKTYLVALSVSLAMFIVGWIIFQRSQRKFAFWL